MRTERPSEVVARILDVARASPGGVVATDADGTLWTGDVGEDLFRAFADHGRIEPPALEAMRREAREFDLDPGGDGPALARRLYAAYEAGSFPEPRACEMMAWCFAGWTRGEVRAFAREVAGRLGLAVRMHGELLEVLGALGRANVEVIVVSASPVAIVEEAAACARVGASGVVAAWPRFEGEIVLPSVDRPIPYAAGKVARLRERMGDRVLYAAFGDNAFDVALLGEARVPVAVRPKAKLRARAGEVEGIVELDAGG